MPDLPTIAEGGVANFEVSSWHGFVVPAGTPQSIIDRLNRDINAILVTEDVRKIFQEQGVVPDGGTPEAFRRFIDNQMLIWKKVVQEGKITAE